MKSTLVGESQRNPGAAVKPRLLFVVSEDWYFLSHRLPMARAARNAGFEVHVATKVTNGAAAIAAEQFVLHPVPFVRGRLSPLATLSTIFALRRLHSTIKPTVTHHISLQPAILGLIAALGHRASCINAFTGLGFAFTSETAKARVLRLVIGATLRLLLNHKRMLNTIQNPDDLAALKRLHIPPNRIVLVRGSGVDVGRLRPLPDPDAPPTVAFVGRLLDDKGIRTLVAAHRLLRGQGTDVRLLIAGTPDPANPVSVTNEEAAFWSTEPGITWLGHVDDISGLWARAHIAVLPSRREGLPLSLLEAAACGRTMIATDVPGCREIVIHEKTGLLVPVDDAPALAGAIVRLASDPESRASYASAARRLVVAEFATDIIGRQTIQLYRRLMASEPMQ